jgi:AcrR family transcriptional regulator
LGCSVLDKVDFRHFSCILLHKSKIGANLETERSVSYFNRFQIKPVKQLAMRTRNPEATRAMIIEKASGVFNVFGFAGTSMDRLMQVTGLKKGGLYNHFSSKQELASEAFKHAYETLKKAYAEQIDHSLSPLDQLRQFVATYRKFVQDPPVEGGCPLLNMAVEVDHTHPELATGVRWAVEDWIGILTKWIVKAQEVGEAHADLNPRWEAQFFVSTIEGAIMLSQITESASPLFGAADRLEAYIDRQLAVPTPSRGAKGKTKRKAPQVKKS